MNAPRTLGFDLFPALSGSTTVRHYQAFVLRAPSPSDRSPPFVRPSVVLPLLPRRQGSVNSVKKSDRLAPFLRLFAANLPGSAFRVFRVFRGHSSAVRDERRLASISG